MRKGASITQWVFLISGFLGAASLSWSTFQGINPCPMVLIFRACYLVLLAYFGMSIAQLMRSQKPSSWLFWIGWSVAFGFAIYGSASEFISGDVCPKSSAGFPFYEIPMCYISLIFCVVIGCTEIFLRHRHT